MNGAQRFLTAARGGLVDRPPVWLMRQAGRYLPEYQTIRREHDFVACCTTPELATEISLQPWRRFGVDGVVVFCDILMPLAAMGLEFSVPEGGPRLSPVMQSTHDIAALHTPDAHSAYPYLTTTLRALRHTVDDAAAIIGFAGGPWTIATYMVAGGHIEDRAAVEKMLKTDHSFRTQLYDKLIPMLADYLTVQIEAGAQVMQIFDTWAGNLSREEFCQCAQPALQSLIERVRKQSRSAAPITLFSKTSAHILPELAACGSDVLSLDAAISLDTARAKSPRAIALQGNLDPEILLTDPETIRAHTTTMLVDGGMTGYIANLGHGVLKQTPPEHVQAFVETVQQWMPH